MGPPEIEHSLTNRALITFITMNYHAAERRGLRRFSLINFTKGRLLDKRYHFHRISIHSLQ